MKSIYEAADAIDAQRVVALLASEGIDAHVSGTHLAGAIGELPAAGLVRVWVHDDAVDAALAVLADDAAAPPFAFDDDEPPVAPVAAPSTPRSLLVPVFVSLVAGALLGAAMAAYRLAGTADVRAADGDGDGSDEYVEEYRGDVLQSIRIDRNRDGRFDLIVEDASRSDYSERYDDDFDGTFETERQHADWSPVRDTTDLDSDGFAEWLNEYRHGVVFRSTLFDPATKQSVKRITYVGGIPVLEEVDADGDGTREIVRHLDMRGEVVPH